MATFPPLIDIQIDRGTATNQVLQWNDTTKRWVPTLDPTGLNTITVTGLGAFGSVTCGLLTTTAGRIKNTSRYTTTQTIPVTDDQVFCNGTFTVTLPVGVDGQTFRIINSGTGTITITSAENIVGSSSDVTLNACDIIILTFETTEGWW